MVVDFSGVTDADSSAHQPDAGMDAAQLKREGRDIAFANLGANLGSLAELYGVADLIPIAAE